MASIDFSIKNPGTKPANQPVLYLGQSNQLNFLFSNNIGIPAVANGDVFTIMFSADLLQSASAEQMTSPDWNVQNLAQPSPGNNYYTFNLTPKSSVSFSGVITIQFQNLQAITVTSDSVLTNYTISGSQIPGTSQTLMVLNPPDQVKDLPSVVDFGVQINPNQQGALSGNVFISPTRTNGQLTPAIPNTIHISLSLKSVNQLVPKWTDSSPQINISFTYGSNATDLTDALKSGEQGYNPQTTAWNIKAAIASGETGQWQLQPLNTAPNTPVWQINPTGANEHLLDTANPTLDIYFSQINSILQGPSAFVFIQWSGIPGYNSGFTYLNLPKTVPVPSIPSFTATPAIVAPGGTSTLAWTAFAANALALTSSPPVDYYKMLNGKKVVNPPLDPDQDSVFVDVNQTIHFNLATTGILTPQASTQLNVSVNPVVIKKFEASATQVDAGTQVILSWCVQYAQTCNISPGGYTNLPTTGTQPVTIWEDTTFWLQAVPMGGSSQQRPLTITVNPVSIPVFTANPPQGVRAGANLILSWQMKSAQSASLQPTTNPNIPQDKLTNSNMTVQPTTFTIFQLTAQGKAGPVTAQIPILPMQLGWQTFTQSAPILSTTQAVLLVRDNTLWVLNGGGTNAAYSVDGATWTGVSKAAPWSMRTEAGGAVFGGDLWLMGGASPGGGQSLNDVWSSADGANWTEVSSPANWSPRRGFGCFVLGNAMYVVGGVDVNGNGLQDVWSTTDGKAWKQVASGVFNGGKSHFGITVYNNLVWVAAGRNYTAQNQYSLGQDVWCSADGINWNNFGIGNWAPRTLPNLAGINNYIYLCGGLDNVGNPINDLNYMASSGGRWTGSSGSPFGGQKILAASAVFQQAIWFAGGQSGAGTGTVLPNKLVFAYAPPL